MCLTSTKRFPKIAVRNIVCYKHIIQVIEKGEIKYHGQIRFNYTYPQLDNKSTDELVGITIKDTQKADNIKKNKWSKTWDIEKGYLHSSVKNEENYACKFSPQMKEIILKCIIPAGTL